MDAQIQPYQVWMIILSIVVVTGVLVHYLGAKDGE